ncbi:MAG: YtxH domain-containing protein [Chloroflexota bacterium]
MKNLQRVLMLVRIGLTLRSLMAASTRMRRRGPAPKARRELVAARMAAAPQLARARLRALEMPDLGHLDLPELKDLRHLEMPDLRHLEMPDLRHLEMPDLAHLGRHKRRKGRGGALALITADVGRSLGLTRNQKEGDNMKFVLGLATGIAIGAVGAVVYASKSGRDLRLSVDEIRAELAKRDTDAVGARLEARMAALQGQLEEQIAGVKARAASVVEQAGGAAKDDAAAAFEVASDALATAAADAGPAPEPGLEIAPDTAS